MNLGHPDRTARLEALAAEFALGTLGPRARRRLARAARHDAAIAAAIERWELRLAALGAAVPPVTPPPRVWNAIAARLGLAEDARAPRWWSSLAAWRGLAVASTVAALALGVVLLTAPPAPSGPGIVVVLAGADARPALVATAAPGEREIAFKAIAPVAIAADRALELWALPDGGPPRSLGLLPRTGTGRVRLAADALERIPALAVSLEPSGGSPTGAPTGPVLYSGRIERL